MKQTLFTIQILLFVTYYSFSQGVGIGTTAPDVSAALDITATNKGLLIPRMNLASINAIPNPATGLLVYDSAANRLVVNIGTAAIPNWQPVAGNGNGSAAWSLTGNAGTGPTNQFIGTTDNQPLRFRINNFQAGELHPTTRNIFWGLRAGLGNTTGTNNIAIGTDALRTNATIGNLIAIGDSALFNNIGTDRGDQIGVGLSNVAIGHLSLFNNTTGQFNLAIGGQSLFKNTTGPVNTAIGFQALFSNNIGNSNTAVGHQSLFSNVTGDHNSAMGFLSLFANVTGSNNTATGWQALHANTAGDANTAVGTTALFRNTTGVSNTAVGNGALTSSTTGNNNTAIGALALGIANAGDKNTALGYHAASGFILGHGNTFIGAETEATTNFVSNSVAIGKGAKVTASDQVRLGNSETTSIGGLVGFSNLSDGRYKKNVRENVKGIDFILKLRPVTYQLDIPLLNSKLNSNVSVDQHQKNTDENHKTIFSGFVAQEVEEAAKKSGYDFSGVDKPRNENDMYGLRYSEFVVPLVKAMQEQQQMIEELKKQNAELLKRVLVLEKIK